MRPSLTVIAVFLTFTGACGSALAVDPKPDAVKATPGSLGDLSTAEQDYLNPFNRALATRVSSLPQYGDYSHLYRGLYNRPETLGYESYPSFNGGAGVLSPYLASYARFLTAFFSNRQNPFFNNYYQFSGFSNRLRDLAHVI